MGMGALVIDVGQLYLEREELQSGADAASFKVALDCVKSGACVTPTAATITTETAVATDYAGRNARDGKATAKICFKATCPTPATGTNPCSNFPSTAAVTSGNYVEVRTSTLTSGNATLIPPVFAGALAGVPYTGKNVAACARVNWGTPAVGRVLAVGISLCDWTRMTTGKGFFNPISSLVTGGVLPLLGLTYPGSTSDSAIVKNETGLGRTTCNGSPLDPLSRGFAVLNNMDGSLPDSSCQIAVNVGDSVPSNFGSDLTSGQDCLNAPEGVEGHRRSGAHLGHAHRAVLHLGGDLSPADLPHRGLRAVRADRLRRLDRWPARHARQRGGGFAGTAVPQHRQCPQLRRAHGRDRPVRTARPRRLHLRVFHQEPGDDVVAGVRHRQLLRCDGDRAHRLS